METFEKLWAECSESSDRDNDERRELADLFWRSGERAERTRIRQMALGEALRHGNEGGGIQNKTLRDFAALLEER